jgi:hypothetical protein
VEEGQTGVVDVTLHNEADRPLWVADAAVVGGAGFDLIAPNPPRRLPSGEQFTVSVRWNPGGQTRAACTLLVHTSGGAKAMPVEAWVAGEERAQQSADGVTGGIVAYVAGGTVAPTAGREPAVQAEADPWVRLDPDSAASQGLVDGRFGFGAFDQQVVEREIQAHGAQIHGCYERELVRDSRIRGRVNVRFFAGSDGSVESVSVERSTLPFGNVEACVVHQFEQMKFPGSTSDTSSVATYALRFSPR